ncbi:MAG: aminotransferase class V-fold PLP-dependent enzyme [Acidimicrobiia bacterium]
MAHRVHLDYASNAPMRASVKEAMIEALNNGIFDPRRLYDESIKSRYDIELSREKIADFFGCEPFEVIFTSSHSESLATFAYGVLNNSDKGLVNSNVVMSPYDSDVIYKTWLREQTDLRILKGNMSATIEMSCLDDVVDENTLGFSIVYSHPDTGTLENIEEIKNVVKQKSEKTIFHVDARSACGNIDLNFSKLGIDAMSVDPFTFGGPSGVAALILSRKCHLYPFIVGATQERARRSGIENHIGIAGFGALCNEVKSSLQNEIENNLEIKTKISQVLKESGAQFLDFDPESDHSISNVVAAYFSGHAASAVVANFNRMGINIHAGSSCGSEEFEISKQLMPVTNDENISESVFRVSWGYATTQDDVDAFINALANI